MFEWLINLPVWIQTPLVVVVAVLICVAAAWLLHWVMWRIVPPTAHERMALGLLQMEDQPPANAVSVPEHQQTMATQDKESEGSQQ